MPALVMSTPTTSSKLERRKSIDDYQRQIINRIKDHFQRSRDEWQRKIHPRKKLERTASTRSKPVETSCSRCQDNSKDFPDNQEQEQSRLVPYRSPSVRILSCNVVNVQSRHMQVTVDISEFLPDGEVTFRTEKNGLLVCAKFPAELHDTPIEKVKLIPVPGLIETERIKVIPVSKGVMTIELKISAH